MKNTVLHQTESCLPPALFQGEVGGLALSGGLLPEEPGRGEPPGSDGGGASWARRWCATAPAGAFGRPTAFTRDVLSWATTLWWVARVKAAFAPYREIERSPAARHGPAGPAEKGGAVKALLLALSAFTGGIFPPAPLPAAVLSPPARSMRSRRWRSTGAWKGGWLALRRLSKCHPFHRQKSIEYDPVP